MEPKLSVIIPVYNVEKYLKRCVDSIRNQSLADLEIILIDDGSTDGSGQLCDRFSKEDLRVTVIHKQNEGQGIARNFGLEMAKGRYAAFVDSDDYMEADAYEFLVRQMEKSDAQLACFGYTQRDPRGSVVYRSTIREREYQKDEIKYQFLLHFFGDDPQDDDLRGVSACMSIYRMDIIKENQVRFLSERKVFSEDTIFNLDYCKYINKVITCQKRLYHYCLKEDSFTKGYQKSRWEMTIYFTELLKKYAKKYGIEKNVENRIKMVLWVSLVDSVKQEVRLKDYVTYHQIRANIKNICDRTEVRDLIEKLEMKGLNRKQKLFYQCIKYKWYDGLYVLGYLRNRRGL